MSRQVLTKDELANALDGLRISYGDTDLGLFVSNPQAFATALFERARRVREPQYEPGAMYEDRDGEHWQYAPREDDNGLCCWLKPGEVVHWSRNIPRQPLRRLIPEQS